MIRFAARSTSGARISSGVSKLAKVPLDLENMSLWLLPFFKEFVFLRQTNSKVAHL